MMEMTAMLVSSVAVIVALVAFFVSSSKKIKEHTLSLNEIIKNNEPLIARELASMNFVVTSSIESKRQGEAYSTSDVPLRMCADFILKRIALVFLLDADIIFIDFDKILSCEVVREETESVSNGNGILRAGVGFAIEPTAKTHMDSLRLELKTEDMMHPKLDIDLLHVGADTSVSGVEFRRAMEFADKVKSLIDNIVAARGHSVSRV